MGVAVPDIVRRGTQDRRLNYNVGRKNFAHHYTEGADQADDATAPAAPATRRTHTARPACHFTNP